MDQLKQSLLSWGENMAKTIWIMDNAPIHVSNEAKEKIIEMEMEWLSICPYSPSLNLIEKFIGAIKSIYAEASFTMKA